MLLTRRVTNISVLYPVVIPTRSTSVSLRPTVFTDLSRVVTLLLNPLICNCFEDDPFFGSEDVYTSSVYRYDFSLSHPFKSIRYTCIYFMGLTIGEITDAVYGLNPSMLYHIYSDFPVLNLRLKW